MIWRLSGGHELSFPPPRAAGIVNVTSDSFFAGARSATPQQAVADGLRLVAAGFDMLDVGALAARAGASVPAEQEAARLVPAIEGLVAQAGVPVIADTFSPAVAREAIAAGAAAINDISGGGEEMFALVAESSCGYVLMHIEGEPRVARPPRRYGDPVGHLKEWFAQRLEAARAAGVAEAAIVLDPGLDFDLGVDDGLEILRRIGELRELGRPVFAALSRKDLLGAILAGSWERRAPAERRGAATAAAVSLAAAEGVELFRLHDPEALDALRVAAATRGSTSVPYAVATRPAPGEEEGQPTRGGEGGRGG